MPQAYSARFADAINRPNTPIGRVDILDGDGGVIQRDVPHLPSGNTTVDRAGASLFQRDVEIPVAALSPQALDALREAAGDVFLQTWRGLRFETTVTHGGVRDSAESWAVSGQSTGVMVGVTVDSNGDLTMLDASAESGGGYGLSPYGLDPYGS